MFWFFSCTSDNAVKTKEKKSDDAGMDEVGGAEDPTTDPGVSVEEERSMLIRKKEESDLRVAELSQAFLQYKTATDRQIEQLSQELKTLTKNSRRATLEIEEDAGHNTKVEEKLGKGMRKSKSYQGGLSSLHSIDETAAMGMKKSRSYQAGLKSISLGNGNNAADNSGAKLRKESISRSSSLPQDDKAWGALRRRKSFDNLKGEDKQNLKAAVLSWKVPDVRTTTFRVVA